MTSRDETPIRWWEILLAGLGLAAWAFVEVYLRAGKYPL